MATVFGDRKFIVLEDLSRDPPGAGREAAMWSLGNRN